MANSNLRLKAIFDQFNIPDLSGGSLTSGLGEGTSFMPGADSPTYEDAGTFRSSNIAGDMRKPEDIRGIGSASNISKVSDVSTKPKQEDYGEISLPDTIKAINDMYTPATRADDRLNNLLDNTPDINNYNPSFMRKFAASLQSIKDPNQGMKTLNQPYLQDMGQWTAKTAPFQAAATGENARNTQERTLASNVATGIISANKNAANQRISDERIRSADEKTRSQAEIARMKNQSYNAAIQGRSIQWDTSGPTVLMREGNKVTDTGVSTGHMSEMDKIELQNAGKVDAARATGEGIAARQNASGAGDVVGSDGQVYRFDTTQNKYVLKEGLPAGAPNKIGPPKTAPVESEANKQKRVASMLQDIYNQNQSVRDLSLIDTSSGVAVLGPKPTVGYLHPETDQKKVALWNQIHDEVNKITGTNTGLSDTPPSVIPQGSWVKQGENAGSWRYSVDGGKSWKVTTNGGKTWTTEGPMR